MDQGVFVCGCGRVQHYARGLCKTCYQAKRKSGGFGELQRCEGCQQDKPKYAKGLCTTCYRRKQPGRLAVCAGCGQKRPHQAKGLCTRCYMAAHAPTYNATRRGVKLKSRLRQYGLTLEQHNTLLVAQGCSCVICGAVVDEAAHVDHCHTTGKVRGILCEHCNRGLGQFRDKPELLRRAAQYLEDNA